LRLPVYGRLSLVFLIVSNGDDDNKRYILQLNQLPTTPEDEQYIAKDREVNLLRYVS